MNTAAAEAPAATAPWQHAQLAALDAAARRRIDAATGIVWRRWGSGPELVLLHGSAGSWTHWLRNIPALARSHTVHVPDLPGNGDSAPLAPGEASMPALADAVQASLQRVREGSGPCTLIGFSLGSFVAEAMALQHPGAVARLVLVRGSFDDAARPMPGGLLRWRQLAGDPAALREAHRHNLALLMFHRAERIDGAAIELHARNQARASADVGALIASRPERALARLPLAPDCICGEFDVLGGGDAAAQGAALRERRPDAGFHVVPDAGHWAPYEQAEHFNALLGRLLAAPAPAPRAAATTANEARP